MDVEFWFWVSIGILLNSVVGAGVLSCIDKDGRLYAWYANAPTGVESFLVLELWPIVALVYWLRR
jgi:hypothetical protein